MRTDLKLNYGALDAVSSRIAAYYNALDDMEQALKELKSVLENQESEAVEELSEKLKSTSLNLGNKKETLRQLKQILDNYIGDMEELVGAISRNEKVRADQYDIWYNIKQIENPVDDLKKGVASAVRGNSSWIPAKEEDYMRNTRQKEERNYTKLENLRSGKLTALANRMKTCVTDIWDIYNNYIKPFEEKDDDYRKKLNAIYKERTSKEDKWDNFWDSFTSIAGSFLKSFAIAFVGAFLVALAPGWLVVGALVVLAVGCVIMANVPEESVPNWLKGAKQAADDVADKAVQVLEEGPIVLVEDIAQDFMDKIQTPEGIAAVAGETIGGFAGGYAGTKVKAKIKTKSPEVEKIPEPENVEAEEIISKRTEGLDLEAHPSNQKQLSSKKMSEIKKKIDNRTATKSEYDAYKWNKKIKNKRAKAVDEFWADEKIRISQGKPTRKWSPKQTADIMNGKRPKYNGKTIQGHHTYSVSEYPHLAGESKTIYPATFNEHFNGWHGGNWKTSKPGKRINNISDF